MSDILDSDANTSSGGSLSNASLPEASLSSTDKDALHEIESKEWLESLQHVLERAGPERAVELLQELEAVAKLQGAHIPFSANTPYVNTIRPEEEPEYPGDLAMEGRIRAIMRWNAMAMVTRANKNSDGIGGHISSFASSATLYDVGLNHFFRGPETGKDADMVYVQGHVVNCKMSQVFLAIHTLGLCQASGSSQLCRWVLVQSCLFIKQGLISTWSIEDFKKLTRVVYGHSLVMVRWTSQNH